MEIQRLTIIPDDQLVMIDNYGITMPIDLPEEIHAIQWQAGQGEIEYKDGRPNEPFTDLTSYQQIIEEHARRKEEELNPPPPPPPPPPTPEEIAALKKAWRSEEIQSVANRLDQYQNDAAFNTDTFPYSVAGDKAQAAILLNDYRVSLIEWGHSERLAETEPPVPPSFWTPAPHMWEDLPA